MDEKRQNSGFDCPVPAEQTLAAVASGRLYPADFRTDRNIPTLEGNVFLERRDVLSAAREHVPLGRTAVLHFAAIDPENPVEETSQTSSLFGATDLPLCLRTGEASRDFYQSQCPGQDLLAFHGALCHRDVTVFRETQVLPEENWFRVDVISCPAPDVTGLKYANRAVLSQLFRQRIRTILEIAMENAARVLILGAFGCGGCGNDPVLVAEAFREVLREERYRNGFDRVVFAVKSSVGDDPYTVCPNIAAFEMTFLGESRELEKLRYVGGDQRDPGAEDVRLPGGRIRYRGSESRAYHLWRQANPYFGKQFSVLGDSISTLAGFNPPGYPVFYEWEMTDKTGVRNLEDTWWGKVISFFGGELLVNDAWSGCRVSRPENRAEPYPSACSRRRTGNLHVGAVKPDVILVYLGFNDWGSGVRLFPEEGSSPELADTFFAPAYSRMLEQLRENYPDAEIWCGTLVRTYVSTSPRFTFPESYAGIPIQEYNRAIEHCALKAGCRLLDLERQCVPYDAVDGTHPNAAGMDTLAALIVRQMADETGSALLDCEREHRVVNGACQRCGARILENTPAEPVLWLRVLETGQSHTLRGYRFVIGRSRDCELRLDNPYVARSQATFVHAQGEWYIRDNDSRNGTFLNGIRLAPDRLCRIRPGDEINVACKLTLVVI